MGTRTLILRPGSQRRDLLLVTATNSLAFCGILKKKRFEVNAQQLAAAGRKAYYKMHKKAYIYIIHRSESLQRDSQLIAL